MQEKPFTREIEQLVDSGIAILKQGGIIAYPTDTVYGLGASMTRLGGIERIFQVKERPTGMALPLLTADVDQIRQITVGMTTEAELLIETFMPGALTVVLMKADIVPAIITGGGKTVAVRIPNHPVPLALIRGLGKPIVGTSANLSGKPSALTAENVQEQIGDKIDLVIDGGRCPGGVESTVVDMSSNKPIIRRLGAITLEQLKELIPEIEIAEGRQ